MSCATYNLGGGSLKFCSINRGSQIKNHLRFFNGFMPNSRFNLVCSSAISFSVGSLRLNSLPPQDLLFQNRSRFSSHVINCSIVSPEASDSSKKASGNFESLIKLVLFGCFWGLLLKLMFETSCLLTYTCR